MYEAKQCPADIDRDNDFGSRSSQVEFLTNLLQIQEIEYETGHRILDSYLKLHKGHSNVNIVLGNLMGRNLGNELQERVWRGEGLILACDKPINSPELVVYLANKVNIKGWVGLCEYEYNF